MAFFKNLVTGKFSLAFTFWGIGVFGSLLLGGMGVVAVQLNFYLFYVILFFRFLLSVMVLSGITFTLRKNKITFLGVLAWIVFLIQVLILMVFNFYLIIGLAQFVLSKVTG
ncbi:hypothetical protein [Yersinia aleksiciae]|uniref:Uncharacterized protein n=2 Tax=Yersinia aleksiciae TaxID=263819 RepID=A0A0T9TET8_YERAE|nr:hypothetical protein [Yersinia aleksiciae]AKP32315.1 hypothetical protein ACZ76_01475 [Yersinia aleksiciae]CFQ53271.1 Uncharacterised protein [Yersinia aleksiciae]CNK77996.1 Uncharacterised protein [Yersinia aleksiciae]